MNKNYYAKDHIFLFADYCPPEEHKHYAKHLLIAMDEKMTCKVEDEIITCHGIFIQSNLTHTVTYHTPLLLYLIDDASELSHRIDTHYLKGSAYHAIPYDMIMRIVHGIAASQDLGQISSMILSSLNLQSQERIELDERIRIVMEIIEQSETLESELYNRLCQTVCLSRSRLSHLFREQVKTSLASYIVFAKVRKTYEYILQGENITQASVHAGFDSASHFAATCKRMFGNSLSTLLGLS